MSLKLLSITQIDVIRKPSGLKINHFSAHSLQACIHIYINLFWLYLLRDLLLISFDPMRILLDENNEKKPIPANFHFFPHSLHLIKC